MNGGDPENTTGAINKNTLNLNQTLHQLLPVFSD